MFCLLKKVTESKIDKKLVCAMDQIKALFMQWIKLVNIFFQCIICVGHTAYKRYQQKLLEVVGLK